MILLFEFLRLQSTEFVLLNMLTHSPVTNRNYITYIMSIGSHEATIVGVKLINQLNMSFTYCDVYASQPQAGKLFDDIIIKEMEYN